jgi:PAS domain S-box-containing protein
MAPNTAFNFALSGLALLILNVNPRKNKQAQILAIVVVLISLISLYGYIYGVKELYGIMRYIPMAQHTAFCFLIISMGILFARPQEGPIYTIIESGSQEVLFIEIFALILPLAFGWLQLKGQQEGYYSAEFGTALFVVLTYVISIFLLGRSSWVQYNLKLEKEMAESAMLEHAQQLQSILDNTATPIVIKDVKGRYTMANKQFEALFHVNSEEITGKTVYDIFPKEIADKICRLDNEALVSGELKQIEEEYPVGNELHTFITVKFPLRDTKGNIYALCSISTDITYRKQLEDTLRTNEQQLRSILQNIGEGVVVVDKNGKFLSFNKVAEDILGIGATEGALSNLAERYGVFRPDGVTPYPSEELSLAKALRGISTDEVELFIRNKKFPEGKQISVTGRPVFNDKQEVIAGVVVFRDITQNKKLVNIIRENEKRLRLVLSSIGEGVVVADTNARFLIFNKKAEEILGNGALDLPFEQWSQAYGLYEPDGTTPLPIEKIPMIKALQGEVTDEVEIFVRNEKIPNGKTITVTGQPIKDEHGNITAGIVDFQDITERKNMEKMLVEIEEKYHLALNFHHRKISEQ